MGQVAFAVEYCFVLASMLEDSNCASPAYKRLFWWLAYLSNLRQIIQTVHMTTTYSLVVLSQIH
jgi:hypothetical protein